jgi:PPOX class probable F420-dependent enzyme
VPDDNVANVLSPEQRDYLSAHRLGVLGTGRRDGSPQLSMIGYVFDDDHMDISCGRGRAKWRNIERQPQVSVLVPDGRRQLIVYGQAELLSEDPQRLEAAVALQTAFRGEAVDGDQVLERLNDENRGIIRVKPDKIFLND